MIKYKLILKLGLSKQEIGAFYTLLDANKAMVEKIYDYNRGKTNSDDILLPLNFAVEEVVVEDTPEKITNYTQAKEYLAKEKPDFSQSLSAMAKLLTIADAWNRMDGFEPDFSDAQNKYVPCFIKEGDGYKFARVLPVNKTTSSFGPKMCFKTETRARQFAEMFIDLWNIAIN